MAKVHGVPAYVVFHDTTLKELVRICPQTEGELRLVSGVGAHKLERYGEDLIEILRGQLVLASTCKRTGNDKKTTLNSCTNVVFIQHKSSLLLENHCFILQRE